MSGGIRLEALPPTRGRYLCARPRRPFSVRCRAAVLDHARLLLAAVAIGLVLAGAVQAVGR